MPCDRWHCGVVPPPQLERVASLFDGKSLPPRPARPVIFRQHKLVDIDVLPICGQRRCMCKGRIFWLCYCDWLGLFAGLGGRLWSRVKEPDPETVAYESSLAGVIAPSQRQHVAVDFDYNRFVRAVFEAFLANDKVAQRDLVPTARQVGVTAWWTCRSNARVRQPNWRCAIAVTGSGDQPVVEVATNKRHECPARRMNPADWQPSGNLGNGWVIARQHIELQLGCGFDREAGVVPSEPCRLRLAAAVDAEQNQRGGATSELWNGSL